MLKPLLKVLGCLTVLAVVALAPSRVAAGGKDWIVSAAARNGPELPTIQEALRAAEPGDTIRIAPGRYAETLATVKGGLPGRPIRVMASAGPGTVEVWHRGRVLTVNHPHIVVEGLAFDGDYGADDTVWVGAAAGDFVLRDCEVRRSARGAGGSAR